LRKCYLVRECNEKYVRGAIIFNFSNNKKVAIVGAGPVGLTLAYLLAKEGVMVDVFESNDDLSMDLRASTFHPATLDLLDRLGVNEELIVQGNIVPAIHFRDRKDFSLIAEFDFSALSADTKHPFRLQCEQWKLTKILKSRLELMENVSLHFSTCVKNVGQTVDGVFIDIVRERENKKVQADWLIACDGVGSAVRKSLKIDYEGFFFPEKFFSISTPFEFADHINNLSHVTYIADPNEWCLMLRAPDLWRIMFPVPPEESDDETTSDFAVQKRLKGLMNFSSSYEVKHKTIYRVQHRIASTYRLGRVLLAGDAAHANNPLGGMGLNSGVHDAFNLADKLLQVILHGSTDELLDRYSRQRRYVSMEHVNSQATQNKELLESNERSVRQVKLDDLRRRAEDPKLAREYMLKASLISSLKSAQEIQ
jgi:3-(3-hydroxy-phenyl)propionate hydroxylase